MTINPQKSCLTTIFFNYGKETKKYFRLIREQQTALVNEEARLWFHQKILLGTSFQLGIKSKELSMEEAQSTWKDRLRMFSEC